MSDSSRQSGQRKESTPIAIIIAIILVSYTLFFYFQISSEFRLKETIVNSASAKQKQDGLQLAGSAEEKLGNIASVLQAASIEQFSSGNAESTAIFLKEIAAETELHTGMIFLVNGSMVENSWVVNEDTVTPEVFDLPEPAASLLPEKPSEVGISSGRIDGVPFLFVARQLISSETSLIVVATHVSEISTDFDAEPYYTYYLADKDFSSIRSLQTEEEYETEADEELASFLTALGHAITNPGAGTVQQLTFGESDEEWIITSSEFSIGNETYSLIITSPVEAHLERIGDILFVQRIQTFSLLAGSSLVTIILASFLSKNIRLDREVKARTSELEKSAMLVNQQKLELEQANAQLKQLDALKDEFINVASHELRNPIQPIIMYAELAKRGTISWAEAAEGINGEAKRLRKLASDILDVSRIQGGGLKYNFNKIKLKPIIDEIVSGARIQVPDEVKVEADIENNDLEIHGDGDRIAQVLQNLISNSIKFTTRGFIRIRVNSDKSSNGVKITLSDTGVGIPPDLMPTLFEKFATRAMGDKNTGGTGLGLFISRSIVEAHGGTLTAENNPDIGASFTILLPIRSTQAGDPLQSAQSAMPGETS